MPGVSAWWVVGVLGVLGVGCGAWALLAGRVRPGRSRRVRRACAAAVAVVLLGLGGLVGWGAASGYSPDLRALALLAESRTPLPAALAPGEQAVPPGGSAERGATWRVRIPSDARGVGDRYAWVHVPPGYDPDAEARYPVAYLLSGSPGTGADWFAAGHADDTVDGLVAAGRLTPTILVAPDLGLGYDQEALDRPGGAQLETFVVRDVVGWADEHLRTVPDAHHRVLGGMSAGALAATDEALRHPDVFGAAVALLPYTGLTDRALRDDPAASAAYEPLSAVAAATGTPRPVFLAAARSDDPADARRIADALTARGHEVRLDVDGGSHDWRFARDRIGVALVWVQQQG